MKSFPPLLLILLLGWPTHAVAHGGPPTRIRLNLTPEGAEVEFSIPLYQVARWMETPANLPTQASDEAIRDAMNREIAENVRISRGGAECRPEAFRQEGIAADTLLAKGRYACPVTGELEANSRLFRNRSPEHRTLLYAQRMGAEGPIPLGVGSQRLIVQTGDDSGAASIDFLGFLSSGVRHILGGADHLLFVLGLVLITAGRKRALLLAVSGFTLAHTATLALAALGKISVGAVAIEPAIGASIGYLGWEAYLNRKADPTRIWLFVLAHLFLLALIYSGVLAFPWWGGVGLLIFAIGFCGWRLLGDSDRSLLGYLIFPCFFGLLHGMGFAGPMIDLDLPPAALGWALLGFNSGVEVGQLGVIAALLLLGLFIGKRTTPQQRGIAQHALALGLMAVGTFWMVQRSVGDWGG